MAGGNNQQPIPQPEPDRREQDDRREEPRDPEPDGRRDSASSESARRRDTRARMNAPISIVLDDEHGNRVTQGTANLANLSVRGALISNLRLLDDFQLDEQTPYTIRFQLMAGPLAGMTAVCTSVRYDPALKGFGVRIPEGFKLPIT